MKGQDTFKRFGFGDGDSFLGEEARELSQLICELPLCPLDLYLHQFAFFLERHVRQIDDPEMPQNYRRLLELNGRRDEYGDFLNSPVCFAKFQGHWYLLAYGQGTGVLRCTASEKELRDTLATKPWEGHPDATLPDGSGIYLGSESLSPKEFSGGPA